MSIFRKSGNNTLDYDDKKLLELVKKDPKNFKLVFEKYFKEVYRYIYSFTLNKESAEDITAETFKRAYLKIKDFTYRNIPLKYWLFKIAVNTLKTNYRKGKRFISIEANELKLTENNDLKDKVYNDINSSRVLAFLYTLPESTQKIIRLKIWEDFTFDQIADMLNMKLSAVKMRYYRGLEKIKELLKDTAKN